MPVALVPNRCPLTFNLSARPGAGAPEAAGGPPAGQRRALLPGACQRLLGPQLPPPEPHEPGVDARAQGRAARHRAGLAAHRDHAHSDHAAQDGQCSLALT